MFHNWTLIQLFWDRQLILEVFPLFIIQIHSMYGFTIILDVVFLRKKPCFCVFVCFGLCFRITDAKILFNLVRVMPLLCVTIEVIRFFFVQILLLSDDYFNFNLKITLLCNIFLSRKFYACACFKCLFQAFFYIRFIAYQSGANRFFWRAFHHLSMSVVILLFYSEKVYEPNGIFRICYSCGWNSSGA